MSANESAELRALLAARKLQVQLDELQAKAREPIAVVGFSSRVPFESFNASMWEGLCAGIDATRDIPPGRWDVDAHYDPDPRVRGTANAKRASFLADVEHFDASFFSISRVEAEAMDPQHRLLLETSWEAIADAGIPLNKLRACTTGAFVGLMGHDYSELLAAAVGDLPDAHAPYLGLGTHPSFLSGRLSYALGITGPSLVVDTACSSSLVALHLACDSLRLGRTDVALVAGVHLNLSPWPFVLLTKLGALSPDGRCRTFDAAGAGFGRGEGCVVTVLKRLRDAVRDGDRIVALVRGSAVNHGGASDGLTAPNGLAHQRLIRAALDDAKLGPADIQYVEAHGTGTSLGDPIEVEALGEVYGKGRTKSSPLAIGSLKSNIGHLEGAAGIAGVLKTVLAIQHRELPPSLHFRTPNPNISWEALPVRVQTELGPWPNPEKPLIAGVSSFGMSGTNAHAIVSEAPATSAEAWKEADRLAGEAKLLPLCISAKTPEALRAYAARYAEYLSTTATGAETWRDIAYTSSVRASHLKHRLVAVGSSRSDWASTLDSFARSNAAGGVVVDEVPDRRSSPVFVFSGQGSQWWGMGRELIERGGVFRETIEECSRYVQKSAGWSLIEELGRDESATRLHQTDITQPVLLAVQMGLVRLLSSWGIEPSVVVGHSAGEIAAACAAGVFTLEQACEVAIVRGRVMQKARGRGKMMWARLSADRAEALERELQGQVEVAGYNAPESIILSGEAEAMERAREMLARQGVETKELKVEYASHCAQMDPFMAELGTGLQWLVPAQARIPLVSTVTAAEGARFDGPYWVRQMRAPVRFAQVMQQLLSREYDLFVEFGPHPVLLASIDQTASHHSKPTTLVPTLRRNDDQERCAFEALGALHNAGHEVDWQKFFSVRGRVVSLPSYPWQRKRYWLSTPKVAVRRSDSPWTLIHRHYASSDQPGKHVFEVELDISDTAHAYFADHKVLGGVWLPGSAFAEMALEAASVAFVGKTASIDALTLSEPLTLTEGEPARVQLVVQPEQEGSYSFRISSRSVAAEKALDAPWVAHASGRLAMGEERGNAPTVTLSELQKRCEHEVDVGTLYEELEAAGLSYGPAFQGIEQAWAGDGEALSKLVVLEKLTERVSGYVVHPSVLDAAFQTSAAAMRGASSGRTYVPTTIEHLRVHSKNAPRWAHVTLRSATEDAVTADLTLLDDEGRVAVEVTGLRALGTGRDKLDERLFEVAWRPSVTKAAETAKGRWLLLADEQGVARELRRWLEARGATVVSVTRGKTFAKKGASDYEVDALDPESMLRLTKEAFGKAPPERVVHLWALDGRQPDAPMTEDAVRRAIELGCVSGLHLVQAIAKSGWGAAPRLFLVTRGSQAVTSSQDVALPEQASLWGYGATIEHEMPDLRTTLVDLDATEVAVEAFATELARADDERRVALRGGKRLVARLARTVRQKNSAARLDSDRTHLITGHRAGMAFAVAERLTELGAKHLTVFGRSTPADDVGAALERLTQQGVHVDLVDVDITDRGALERALVELTRAKKPLGGIFHSADLADDGAFCGLSGAQIAAALTPSVLAAVRLEQLASNVWRDANSAPAPFVLWSSASSMLASAGQSNNTATSAFFDAFAHYHARSSGRALSIASSPRVDSASVSEAAELFGRALATTSTQMTAIDFRQWQRDNSRLARLPLVRDLVSARKDSLNADPVAVQARLRELLGQFTSHPNVDIDTNLLAGILDSLAGVSFFRAVEKTYGLRNLISSVSGTPNISLRTLTTSIMLALASGKKTSPSVRKHSIVLPDPAGRRPRATNAARRYPEVFGGDGLPSAVWETDVGVSLEVLERGSGRCLLLLPPFGCELTVWKPFLEHFRADRRIIAVNLPGYGRSPLPADLSLEVTASALLALIEAIQPEAPIDVVGWSIGGFITQMMAAAAPKHFRTLSLVNTTAHLGIRSFEDGVTNFARLDEDLSRDLALYEQQPGELERLVYWGKQSRTTEVSMTYSALIQSFDARATASEIKTPTLIVSGEKDLITPISMGIGLHESVPGSRLEVIPNVGHYTPLLRPEAFVRLVEGHLEAG